MYGTSAQFAFVLFSSVKGQVCMEEEQFEDAVRCFTKAINLDPKHIDYYTQRGEAFMRLCDYQSAILNYKKACILDPDNPQHYNRLAFIYYFYGQCLFDQKLFPEALESFSRAAEMRPEIVGYHMRRYEHTVFAFYQPIAHFCASVKRRQSQLL